MTPFISPQKALAHIDRLSRWRSGEKPYPVTIEWDLSNACSLGCQFCHFAHTHISGPWASQERPTPKNYHHTGRFADTALVRRVLSDMADGSPRVEAIVWSGGGEPTLHPEYDQIVTLAHALGFSQGLYTLGGHIPQSRADLLRRVLAWAVISLDAPDAATYAAEKHVGKERFAHACDGIARLSGGSCVVGVSFLLHADNWPRAPEMLEVARRLGATYTTFRPTIQTSPARPSVCLEDRAWISDALPMLWELHAEEDVEVDPARFEQYRDWAGHTSCHGITLVGTITPDGRMWICPNRRGVSLLGDLQWESFSNVWAKHPGQWTDFTDCRVMCRLHRVNDAIAPIFVDRDHEVFV